MNNNRIRTIVRTAVGSGLIASALGLSALGLSSVANAAPTDNAPKAVYCQVYDRNGVPIYWYWGPCR
ncbi:hypothetical protein A9W99_22755 [Mycobacterium sp. 1164966.3]|jgi:hypothetical protein|uniref:hypothetical protein n=1 Tax=unclassified Mycobacterium TaxID=2642494 RepID=UPI0007FC6516|nr:MULTISPECIES: hypothetical protein [unclassified Mycobacterium]OBA78510.1 hypothetical protein A9W99_22755 [Mycobacterium sp. 1164966.3]OBF93793.1 hypothetical protein A5791_12295 [Mycobacterium sp. 852002-51163_SCH5372311]